MNRHNYGRLAFLPLSFLAIVSGCGSSDDLVFGSRDSTSSSTGEPGSSSGGVGGMGGGGGAGGGMTVTWPQACPDIYDENIVPSFDLTFTPDELNNLQIDCSNHV